MNFIPLFGYAAVVCSRDPAAIGCAEFIAKSAAAAPYLSAALTIELIAVIVIAAFETYRRIQTGKWSWK